MIKFTSLLFWRIGAIVCGIACVACAILIWVSATHETTSAMDNGLRVVAVLETNKVEGKQATDTVVAEEKKPSETPIEKPEETPTITPEPEIKAEPTPPAPASDTPIEVKVTLDDNSKIKTGEEESKAWKQFAKDYKRKGQLPMIAVVVTGLGQNKSATDMAVKLPENFSLSFTPYAKDFAIWTNAARIAGHEVLMDLPLEPVNYPASDPGPYGLLVGSGNQVNSSRLEWLMARGQGYVGFLTPQNDAFSSNSEAFKNLLADIGKQGLLIQMGHEPSKNETVELLNASKVPFGIADILIDEELSVISIQSRLISLQKLAAKRGFAVGVAQAFPLSVQQLAEWSAKLEKEGYELVPLTAIVAMKFNH
jgi:uncharacterized protein